MECEELCTYDVKCNVKFMQMFELALPRSTQKKFKINLNVFFMMAFYLNFVISFYVILLEQWPDCLLIKYL